MKLTPPRIVPRPETAKPITHKSPPIPGEYVELARGAYAVQPNDAAPPGDKNPETARTLIFGRTSKHHSLALAATSSQKLKGLKGPGYGLQTAGVWVSAEAIPECYCNVTNADISRHSEFRNYVRELKFMPATKSGVWGTVPPHWISAPPDSTRVFSAASESQELT